MKKTLAILLNVFVGIMSFGSWLYMTVRVGDSFALTTAGFESLKYFTVLSNLFNGAISLVYAFWLLRGKEITRRKKTLKLVATSAVGLTFVTVMAFLGPLYGYPMMFQGANFWLHLVLPVLSFVSFIFFERGGYIPFAYTFWALVPTALYSIGYIGNVAINGIGTWPDTNDFYGFFLWGYAVAAIIAVVILLVTWIIALVLRLAGGAHKPTVC